MSKRDRKRAEKFVYRNGVRMTREEADKKEKPETPTISERIAKIRKDLKG